MLKITDFSIHTDIGGRDYMEDRVFSKQFGSKKRWHLYVVADGHGGEEAADYVIKYLTLYHAKWFQALPDDLLGAGTNLLDDMQNDFETEAALKPTTEIPGSTITGCVIDTIENQILLFNLGDSQTALYKDSELVYATVPHTTRSANERKIIENRHPTCKFDIPDNKEDDDIRLYGLNLTRAFGNLNIPDLSTALNRDVDFTLLELTRKTDLPLRIVIASDGLWDDFAPKSLIKLEKQNASANELIDLAKTGSKGDNIAIIAFTVMRKD